MANTPQERLGALLAGGDIDRDRAGELLIGMAPEIMRLWDAVSFATNYTDALTREVYLSLADLERKAEEALR